MFAKYGTYQPVGMFSTTHIISVVICFALIITAVILTRKMKSATYFKLLKIFAVMLTSMEAFKISWNLINGNTGLDSWLPLYFCSLFIYSLWFCCFNGKTLKGFGLSYIACAAILAGAVFVIFPTTSFRMYPIFHFQCLYSMIFHSIMIYCGIMVYVSKSITINWKTVLNYILFCAIFMLIAWLVNINTGSNLMFISNPSGIPIPALKSIYKFSHNLYSFTIVVAHMLIGPTAYGVYALTAKLKKSKPTPKLSHQVVQPEELEAEPEFVAENVEEDEEILTENRT